MQQLRFGIFALVVPLLLPACAVEDDDLDPLPTEFRGADHDDDDDLEPLDAKGGFSCDFEFDSAIPLDQVPAILERDRMHMADQDGHITKRIPLNMDPVTGQVFGGGRYLFEKRKDARKYKKWVTKDYELDGVQLLDRPEFLATDCHVWRNIAAYDFTDDPAAHVVMRTERWEVPGHANVKPFLKALAPFVAEQAEAAGLTSIWMFYDKKDRLVELVYYGGRVAPPPPGAPDLASLGALASMPTLGGVFDALCWHRVLDRTSFVFTTWFPFELGDQGEAALFPNSPPFPGPFCGDGVCVPSRGEEHGSCPADCSPDCGDGYCDIDEDEFACPSDCRLR